MIERGGLDELLGALRRRGFTPIGPTVRRGAIVEERALTHEPYYGDEAR